METVLMNVQCKVVHDGLPREGMIVSQWLDPEGEVMVMVKLNGRATPKTYALESCELPAPEEVQGRPRVLA